VDRSLRRRGQRLVVAGALLGAVAGAGLGVVVGRGETPRAVAAPARGASAAANRPSGRPSGTRATTPRPRAGDGSGGRRIHLADHADRRDKAAKHGKHDREKPDDRKKGKPGKDR
jgi:hypothetical protein